MNPSLTVDKNSKYLIPPEVRFEEPGSTDLAPSQRSKVDDKLAAVAVKTMEQGVQCDEASMPASAKYPLDHLDFTVLDVTGHNIDELDGNLPEVQPYQENAGKAHVGNKEFKKGILGRTVGFVSNMVKWNARNVSNWFRTGLYRTENEILRDMCDPDQEVRVSNSWFLSSSKDGREVYYGLNHSSSFQEIFMNTPKWLWYEGITSLFTSDKTSTLKLFQVLPHVLQDRIEEVNKTISLNVEKLARVAVTVLEDEDYVNEAFSTRD